MNRNVKRISSRALAIVLVAIMLCGSVIGGTVAWLIDQTDPVVNTFTFGDVNIDLEESDTGLDDDNDVDTNDYEMVPGETIIKDPRVTVFTDSKACWLYVKLEKSENFDDFMEYEMTKGWTQLKDVAGNDIEGVFYRPVDEVTGEDVVYEVIRDNEIYVKGSVTKEMLYALGLEGGEVNYPTLTVTAYAVQYSGFEPEISEGAVAPTAEQNNDAALRAWEQIAG